MNEFEQGLLKFYSQQQLDKLRTTKIGIAGCGGLGSNVATALVRSGFSDIEIADHDDVEASNLNRQNYYIDEIGMPKVEALWRRLKKINPDISIKARHVRIDEYNIESYFADRDIIFEAFDTFEDKKLFLETFGNSGKLLIMGSGMAGVRNETNLKIMKVRENVYIVGDRETEAGKENVPLAPRVIACAALMASVALERSLPV